MDKDKYVTHEELNHAVDNLNNKIDFSTEKILHHIDNENGKMKSDLKITNTRVGFILGILIPVITALIIKMIVK